MASNSSAGLMPNNTSANVERYEVAALPPKVTDLSVLKTYEGRNLFITGTTGFIGKVMLEKILRSIPNVGKVYLLIRPRKGQKPMQRLKEEVLSSPAFDPLRKLRPDFDTWIETKLVPVAGELTIDNVGLSDEDLAMIQEDLDMVIHCAAVVDFNERLDRAIQLNTLGSLRMLNIAKQSKRCAGFVHVSTCYVNSNLPNGNVEERLYPLGFEPEELIESVSRMSSTELDTITSTGILRNWPNTYTMTKSMAEHLVIKNKGDMPVVILRPSIVGCSAVEPYPGWVDNVSAAGACYTAIGVGLVKFVHGNYCNIGDLTPVDYVVNAILVSLAVTFKQYGKHYVCHAASSSENPMSWGHALCNVLRFFKDNPPPRSIAPAKFNFTSTPQVYQLRFFLEYSIPSSILNTLSLTGSNSWKKKAQMFEKLQWQVRVISEAFKYFIENEWIFNNRNVRTVYGMMPKEEQAIFNLDLKTLDWARYNTLFAYGLNKYTFKAPAMPALGAEARYLSLITEQYDITKDNIVMRQVPDILSIKEATVNRAQLTYPAAPNTSEVIASVLDSSEICKVMEDEVSEMATRPKKKKDTSSPAEVVKSRAKGIVERMFSTQSDKVIASLAYGFKKVWRRLYNDIHIAKQNLEAVRAAAEKGPIVYLPTHRSYIDFLLCSYVAYFAQLPLPHIAAGEDFLGIFAVRWIFRNAGAFFIRRSFSADLLYTAVLQKYTDKLLQLGQSLEFYIEGTRSRSGKMLQPKMGMLSMITSAVQRGVVPDVTLVPMSFNYEKPMEGFMYGTELSGEQKRKETLGNLFKASSVLNSNFGAVTVCFSQPISVKDWMRDHLVEMNQPGMMDNMLKCSREEKRIVGVKNGVKPDFTLPVYNLNEKSCNMYMNRRLAYEVVHRMLQGNEVMPTHLVAALMLQYRQGITRAQLVAQVEWTYYEILLRKGYVHGVELLSLDVVVDKALEHQKDLVRKQNRNIYEPAISARNEYTNLLVLGQYKNRLVHYFYKEALWCVAIKSFIRTKKVALVDEVLQVVRFLHVLLKNEFIVSNNPDVAEDHMLTLSSMLEGGILSVDNGKIEIPHSGETHFTFLCALLWPSIDSVYSAALILYSLQGDKVATYESLIASAQWLANTQYHEGRLSFFEACSRDTLDNSFKMFTDVGILEVLPPMKKVLTADGSYTYPPQQVRLTNPYHEECVIDGILDKISVLRKSPMIETSKRRDLIFSLPGLAKMQQSK